MKVIEVFVAQDGNLFTDEDDCVAYEKTLGDAPYPYIYSPNIHQNHSHNPLYPENAICECGHPYYRHFDPYEDYAAVGCKYCGCHTFKLAKE